LDSQRGDEPNILELFDFFVMTKNSQKKKKWKTRKTATNLSEKTGEATKSLDQAR
jgi:hypothetical protein